MMNFQVTGKKMTTQTPIKKQSQLINSQPKTVPPKPTMPKQKQQASRTQKPSIGKIPPVKQKQKKQEIKKIEQKQQKQPSPIQVKPIAKVNEQKEQIMKQQQIKQDIIGDVTVRYNHYKEKFTTVNGILSFLPIQEKYSFGCVFKGNFLPILKRFRTNEEIGPEVTGKAVDFSWKVENNLQYKLQIQEDEVEEAKFEKTPYKAPVIDKCCPFKKNPRFEQLTLMMKNMDPSQYGSAKHRQLLQQRDLQDVLFS